jgi:nucleotide-binding universal stress UspA family protein
MREQTGGPAFASILVHVDLGVASARRIALASELAKRFDATLLGVAAEEPLTSTAGQAPGTVGHKIAAQEELRILADLRHAEELFQSSSSSCPQARWWAEARASTDVVLEQARAADLIVVGRQGLDDEIDWRLGVTPGELVMGLGRPMLMVPPSIKELSAARVVVAWKDTREARRAVWDAMPFLCKAEEVLVVAVDDAQRDAGGEGVASYIQHHGARRVRALSVRPRRTSVLTHLLEVADGEGSDFLVAGAYGHSRMREWALGGVTQELLETSPACCLLSH